MAEIKAKKKRTKISRTRTGKKPNMYFHDGTASAIEEYQGTKCEKCIPESICLVHIKYHKKPFPGCSACVHERFCDDCSTTREKLYNSEIFPAFDKLVENLIFIHGFQGLHDSYEDLKNDCVTFLYEAIHKFDSSRGSKPFSYFNVVAKNWLIIRSKQKVAKLKRSVSIDDIEILGKRDAEMIEGYQVLPAQDEQMAALEFIMSIHSMLDEIKNRVLNENEHACIDAVIHIFKNIEKIDLLNKRAVFLYIRNISGLSPKQLTTAIASIKKFYKELKDSEDFGLY